MHPDIHDVLTHEAVIALRAHPRLASAIRWAHQRGELVRLGRGVYGPRGVEPARLRPYAVQAIHPDAIFTAETAAWLHGWPTFAPTGPASQTTVALRSGGRPAPGVRPQRRVIDPDWVCERAGLRCTTPALTALDLLPSHGADVIDTLLRTRQLTLADLAATLAAHPGRRHNVTRRWLVEDSRDEPWSAAERLAHRLLREGGIGGWRANWGVRAQGSRYFVDIAFPDLLFGIEVDGWEFHRERFEADHRRFTDLLCAGWVIMPVTYAMLLDPGLFLHRVGTFLADRLRTPAQAR